MERQRFEREATSTGGVHLGDLSTFMTPEQIERLRQGLTRDAQLRRDAVAESYQHRIT